MFHLLRKKSIWLLITLIAFATHTSAQGIFSAKPVYRESRDYKPFYFGISLGYVNATLHPSKSEIFLAHDSILVAEPVSSPGYSVRLMANARLSNRFEARFNPGLILGVSRQFTYTLGSRESFENIVEIQTVQSNIATFPLSVKFNSDRIHNFKVYMLAGATFNYDLASNATARNADDLLKLNRTDIAAELGIGFNFFLPFVTVSPEIKFSNGLTNVHATDANLKYSNILGPLQGRMLFFTIHLEE